MELCASEDPGAVIGKENLVSTVGKALSHGSEILCPVSTSSAFAIGEQPELRAYKLGKQKCSYNQVELIIKDLCNDKDWELQVSEAIETAVGNEVDDLLKESCLKFHVRFLNTERMHLYIYVVYASPYCSIPEGESKQAKRYYWVPVTRSKCRKGCKGPVIRGLQRFGRMSRRVSNTNSYQAFVDHGVVHRQENLNALPTSNSNNTDSNYMTAGDSWKEPRHLYIAIDEASTHVCPRPQTSKFRLLVAAYDDQHHLLGSAVSSCVRVLANNDAPLGAAAFKLHCHIKGTGKSENCSPCVSWPGSGLFNDRRQCGRVPLQEMTQIKLNPWMETTPTLVDYSKSTSNPQVLSCTIDQELHFTKNEQECVGESPSSSCSNEAPLREENSSLEQLCQRVFNACSCKQQGVITLRKFATILGASRNLLLDIFSVLAIIQVVQEQGKEKYLWLGSDRVKAALQEILVNENLSRIKNSETRFDPACKSPSISELGKRFCLLFLSNKDAAVKWEFAVETILGTRERDTEIMRTMLWKISVILSALHLIVSKRGPVFEWSGSEGVAAHLKLSAHQWLIRRCRPKHQRPNKYRKIDSDDLEKDSFATSKNMHTNSCQHAQICRSLDEKRARLSPPQLQPYVCDSDEKDTTRRSHPSYAVNGICTYAEPMYSWEELHRTEEYNLCHSSIGKDCVTCSQTTHSIIACDEENEQSNDSNSILAALNQGSVSPDRDEPALEDICYRLPYGEHVLPSTRHQWMATGYSGLKGFNNRQGHEGQSSDCGLAFLSCSNDDSHLIANNCLACHVASNANWHFDPLAYLVTLYTPEQIINVQQCNPGFLINFVRYFRQLYHKYRSNTNALVQLPSAIRPCYSSFMLKNLAAKYHHK